MFNWLRSKDTTGGKAENDRLTKGMNRQEII